MVPRLFPLQLAKALLPALFLTLAFGCGDKPQVGEGGDAGTEDTVAHLPLVPGLANTGLGMTAIEWYQGVLVPIMANGEPAITGAVPIIAGKDAVVRAYIEVAAGFQPRTVWLRVELTNAAGMKHFDEENEVTVTSTAASIASTLNVTIPGAELEAGQAISVSIRETSESAVGGGDGDGTVWPAGGATQDLGVLEQMAPTKLVLVPVQYDADGSGRLPDTSQAQLQLYNDLFYALYPVTGVEITVDPPMPFSGTVGAGGNGWEGLLNAVTERRNANGAGADEFYYGLVSPADSFLGPGGYCSGGCVTGLSWLATGPGSMQVGTGIGWAVTDSAWTAVHELGHSFGLNHAPCGGAGGPDPNFPYSDGGIGVMGYDVTKGYTEGPLKDPTVYKDIMGYCPPDQWVSDYNFDLLYDRVEAINDLTSAAIAPPPGATTRWRSISIAPDGTVSEGPALDSALPIAGEPRTVTLLDADGTPIGDVEGVFVARADLGGGLVVFREPDPDVLSAQVPGFPSVALE